MLRLYLIEILHQTTTLSLSIKSTTWLYLIEILHQTTTIGQVRHILNSCILSKFYIKPQRSTRSTWPLCRCILSKFYIKPQRRLWQPSRRLVVSYRNSTSNHNETPCIKSEFSVVSYRNSTSNHNLSTVYCAEVPVVSYRNSTSNHNYLQ